MGIRSRELHHECLSTGESWSRMESKEDAGRVLVSEGPWQRRQEWKALSDTFHTFWIREGWSCAAAARDWPSNEVFSSVLLKSGLASRPKGELVRCSCMSSLRCIGTSLVHVACRVQPDTAGFTFVVKSKRCQCFQDYKCLRHSLIANGFKS